MITQTDIDNLIETTYFHRIPGTTTTVCAVTLKQSGFVVIGVSACILAENFDEDISEMEALKDAKNKVWQLEGYRLRNLLALSEDPEIQANMRRLEAAEAPKVLVAK